MMCGGFSEFKQVTEEELAIFKEATEGLLGVSYEPLIVAKQIVAGTNYKFICNATAITLHPQPYLAALTIFKPLPDAGDQRAILSDIHTVN